MDKKSFVDAIRTEVAQAAVADTLNTLRRPPGRRPRPALVALSTWFVSLAPAEQEHLRAALEMAAGQTAFGFLCVLDGVRAIEDGPAKGRLALSYIKDDVPTLLNGPDGHDLHDLFWLE